MFYFVEEYFKYAKESNLYKNDEIFEIKNSIVDNLNSFVVYNINQKSLINAINNKLLRE